MPIDTIEKWMDVVKDINKNYTKDVKELNRQYRAECKDVMDVKKREIIYKKYMKIAQERQKTLKRDTEILNEIRQELVVSKTNE